MPTPGAEAFVGGLRLKFNGVLAKRFLISAATDFSSAAET